MIIKPFPRLLAAVLLFSVFTTPNYACPLAASTTSADFCNSFKSVAQCHCMQSGLPSGMCSNMQTLYDRMLFVFHSLEQACRYQHDTSIEDCINAWNCYRHGGMTSTNELCSGTGAACA